MGEQAPLLEPRGPAGQPHRGAADRGRFHSLWRGQLPGQLRGLPTLTSLAALSTVASYRHLWWRRECSQSARAGAIAKPDRETVAPGAWMSRLAPRSDDSRCRILRVPLWCGVGVRCRHRAQKHHPCREGPSACGADRCPKAPAPRAAWGAGAFGSLCHARRPAVRRRAPQHDKGPAAAAGWGLCFPLFLFRRLGGCAYVRLAKLVSLVHSVLLSPLRCASYLWRFVHDVSIAVVSSLFLCWCSRCHGVCGGRACAITTFWVFRCRLLCLGRLATRLNLAA